MDGEEKFYGTLDDRTAWKLALSDRSTDHGDGYQSFKLLDESAEPGGPLAVARAEGLGVYVRTFVDGGGENGLHAHPDDGIWLVLEGRALFFAAGGRPIGDLGPGEGVLVPADGRYRFVCSGRTTLARIGTTPTPGEVT